MMLFKLIRAVHRSGRILFGLHSALLDCYDAVNWRSGLEAAAVEELKDLTVGFHAQDKDQISN